MSPSDGTLLVLVVLEMLVFALYVWTYRRLWSAHAEVAAEVRRANPVGTYISVMRFVHRRRYEPLGDRALAFWGEALRAHYWVMAGLGVTVGMADTVAALIWGG